MEVTFLTGEVISYDMAVLFSKYPQLEILKDRDFFTSGKLIGSYGIRWNDDIDIEVETIFEDGTLVRKIETTANIMVAYAVTFARNQKGLTQSELAQRTGIDQSDISKIERGVANPSVNTLKRIADALDAQLTISIA